jgi:hypothetical protein
MLVDVCFYDEPMVWGSRKYIISVLVLAPVLIPVSQINKNWEPNCESGFKNNPVPILVPKNQT